MVTVIYIWIKFISFIFFLDQLEWILLKLNFIIIHMHWNCIHMYNVNYKRVWTNFFFFCSIKVSNTHQFQWYWALHSWIFLQTDSSFLGCLCTTAILIFFSVSILILKHLSNFLFNNLIMNIVTKQTPKS